MGVGDENLKMIYPDFPIESYVHHLNRYRFADNMLPGNIQIFDYCSGTGYGTDMLNKKERTVIGFDNNKESIEYANKYYKGCMFIEKDIVNLNITYTDAVVMFECIEHLSDMEGKKVLFKINKFANYVVLSTPKDSLLGENKFHKSQWSVNELIGCLNEFDVVSVFGQDWQSGQILFPFSNQISMYVLFGYKKKDGVPFGSRGKDRR